MRVTTESTSTVIDLVSIAARSLVEAEIGFRKVQMESDQFDWTSTTLNEMQSKELQVLVSIAKRTGEFFNRFEACVVAVLTARAATCGAGRVRPVNSSQVPQALPEEIILEALAEAEAARKLLQEDLEEYSDLPNEYPIRANALKGLLAQLAIWQEAIEIVMEQLRELMFVDG